MFFGSELSVQFKVTDEILSAISY